MRQPTACLTVAEYSRIREAIDFYDLWWDDGQRPRRIVPTLRMRTWGVRFQSGLSPLIGVAAHRVRRVAINDDAPCGVQLTALAHTLAHDLLGHDIGPDRIISTSVRHRSGNPGVDPRLDAAAHAATALMLVPDHHAYSGATVEQIAAVCRVPTKVVVRRLSGVLIRSDDPPTIIRIDRRGPDRPWHGEPARTGTDHLIGH